MTIPYVHDENVHHMGSPEALVPVLIDLFRPASVVDFGCGIGTFLRAFREKGLEDVLGLDGPWVDREKLVKNIPKTYFRECDLGKSVQLDRHYDLAISFEVGEHLPPDRADTFVENIARSSDIVVFGAAIPFQGGQHHLNEQWPEYWADHFAKQGLQQYDLIRPAIWNNEEIQAWYRQNIFVYARSHVQLPMDRTGIFPPNFRAVHPELFTEKAVRMEEILSGRATIQEYLKLLGKALIRATGRWRP